MPIGVNAVCRETSGNELLFEGMPYSFGLAVAEQGRHHDFSVAQGCKPLPSFGKGFLQRQEELQATQCVVMIRQLLLKTSHHDAWAHGIRQEFVQRVRNSTAAEARVPPGTRP